MAGRIAPGGNSTLDLGGEYPDGPSVGVSSSKFANGANQNSGNVITDRPSTKLHQAPGGDSTICLGGGYPDAPAVGVSSNKFANGANQNSGNVMTDRSTTRLHQAPGGTSTICLGADDNEVAILRTPSKRVPAGGEATLSLGDYDVNEVLSQHQKQRDITVETPEAAPRFQQMTGGNATVVLGEESADLMFSAREQERSAVVDTPDAARRFPQAPGGASTLCFGTTGLGGGMQVSSNCFANGANQNNGNVITDRPSTRLHHAPGGASTICLGSDDTEVPTVVSSRGPVGGEATICFGSDDASAAFSDHKARREAMILTPEPARRFQQATGGNATVVLGGDDSKELFAQRTAERHPVVETPDAAPRFQQAPGGTSTITFGGEDLPAEVNSSGRVAPGGTATICLGADGPVETADLTSRGPVGGETTITLGTFDSTEEFNKRRAERECVFQTPDAAQRFPQSVGGTATVVLGDDTVRDIFKSRKDEREATFETPAAAPRFPQAPGGNSSMGFSDTGLGGTTSAEPERANGVMRAPGGTSTICLGDDGADAPLAVTARGPVGGEATISLGSHDAKRDFQEREKERDFIFQTPDAAPRFPQAPGGTSSLEFGASEQAAVDTARGPVGGLATVVLGDSSAKADFEQRKAEREMTFHTPEAAPRFRQAPGGNTSIALANDGAACAADVATRGPVGGETTIVFGSDDVKESFSHRAAQRNAAIETPDAAQRFPQAPGGTSSMCFGETGLGGAAVSSNCFANGSNQNCGNVLTDRPSTRLHHAPGGASTICLGGDNFDPPVAAAPRGPVGGEATICLGSAPGSEAFAEHTSRREAVVNTPDAAPRFPQATGGTSTISLGTQDSKSIFSERQEERALAVSTPDAAPRFPQAPGGNTSICLGTDNTAFTRDDAANDENVNASNIIQEDPASKGPVKPLTTRQAPGGTATVLLG